MLTSSLRQACGVASDKFIYPLLSVIDSPDNFKSTHAVIRAVYQIIESVYLTLGMSIETKHWDCTTFYRIVLFACIWSFSSVSINASFAVDSWFSDLYAKESTSISSILDDVLPPSNNPYDYCLKKYDEDEVIAIWVHWANLRDETRAPPVFTNSLRSTISQYCTSYEFDTNIFVASTPQSVVASFMQYCFLESNLNSTRTNITSLAIIGEPGVGTY